MFFEVQIKDKSSKVLNLEERVAFLICEGTVINKYAKYLSPIVLKIALFARHFAVLEIKINLFNLISSALPSQYLMITFKRILLTLVLLISLQACNLTIQGQTIRTPRITQLNFPTQINATLSLCFELNLPQIKDRVYLVRLDYLPYVCLNAGNQVLLKWNGTRYTAQVQVSRKCKRVSLRADEQQAYKLVYEFRKGYLFEGIALLQSQVVEQYLPTILVLFIASYFIQRKVFVLNSREKNKPL